MNAAVRSVNVRTKDRITMAKRNKIIYWISTLWLALGMTATGIVQLIRMESQGALAPPGVYGIKY